MKRGKIAKPLTSPVGGAQLTSALKPVTLCTATLSSVLLIFPQFLMAGCTSSVGTPPRYKGESTVSLTASPAPLASSAQSSTAAEMSEPRFANESGFQSPSQ
ncbi:hypothetical protein EYF80_022603 [Liparis tanakae]|uniref:Uncharacterized protein n=1 Tax=Liparis tanakae TaxID=230148 RepID=A0A4Z2HMV8_9TELE|nr:hypothetical protein EYF80_022603 [Liparis tanakae]